ncbi:MAG TPA: hypothetical protein VF648_00730 [Pyrinomonadaceae bacterium]|jgi:hypothetical protein
MSEILNLQKFVWTESDFEQMNWRESRVYAFAFLPKRTEFLLDIDYILQRIYQPENANSQRFLVAAATLVFENVSDLRIELEPNQEIEIINIERSAHRKSKNSELINRKTEWKWIIKTNQGDIGFRAVGYKQHFKGMPILGQEQALDLDLRGGFSFSRVNEVN